ncbi:DNA/RNA non-specific endonuclease [Pseudomonas gingeri]|uniref:DNA/RNA non-specific endonuclease n=2 Tax=Pseudomonas gingeri TaxID=117681 RepID=A0A7Y7XJY3_9PSED|nr:DNA/RNA non-specific endonuclease [Pseudomonas gingeri]NWC00244.1 DNA/RNA non-specific endonuclease [Pseudomonas gingeri]
MSGGSGPSASIRPPGFVTGGCPNHHQRGHLIGNQLGGSGTDPNNLVTLTEGSNHPFMYEYEKLVYDYVKGHSGSKFTYLVTANYDTTKYYVAPAAPGGAASGAMSNPYCPLPCPESLTIEFFSTDGNGAKTYPIPVNAMTPTGFNSAYCGPVTVQNGGYKFHEGSLTHIKNNCWAT